MISPYPVFDGICYCIRYPFKLKHSIMMTTFNGSYTLFMLKSILFIYSSVKSVLIKLFLYQDRIFNYQTNLSNYKTIWYLNKYKNDVEILL